MPEKETPTQNRPTSRTQRIEEFLLDPEKVIFESLEEFQTAVAELLDIFSTINIEELEKIQGQDGYTPKRGKDYFTEADINNFESFILDRMPKEGVDYPTRIQMIEAITAQVAAIPRIKGDKGDPGKKGEDGKDGSPDTALDIVKKIRTLKNTNQGLKITDVRGLQNVLRDLIAGVDSIEELRMQFDKIKVVLPAVNSGESSGGGEGLTAEQVRDAIASAFEAGTHTGITFTHDDDLNTFTLEVTDTGGLTEEQVEDIVNGLIVAGAGITATYNDVANTLTLALSGESFTSAMKTKVDHLTVTAATDLDTIRTKAGHITVTQAVDLDQMETDIAALANGMVYKGDWAANAGTFPGAGAAQTGWFYYVSVAGTVDGVEFAVGDNVVATVDNASATVYTANWSKHDQTDAVQAVAGLTGSITASALRTALNVEDGADVTDAVNVAAVNAAAASKTTPVDADSFPIINSESSNVIGRVTFTNLKAFLKTYFDSMTSTFTNKRITRRTGTTTSSATPTINTDNVDEYYITAQTADITSFTTNLSGTPTEGQLLFIAITGTAARAITWGASFENGSVALPTTTVTTTRLDVLFKWNTVTNKWRCMAAGSTA